MSTSTATAGVKIFGKFNRRNFIEFENETSKEYDRFSLLIVDPTIDPTGAGSAIDAYQYYFMPCEKLTVTLRLEKHKLLNRKERPCRTDYPPVIAEMFMKNVSAFDCKPENFLLTVNFH